MDFSDFYDKVLDYVPKGTLETDLSSFRPNYSFKQLEKDKNSGDMVMMRGRVACLLLYPDDPSHLRAIRRLEDWKFKYSAILHNWDKLDDDSFLDELDDDYLIDQFHLENQTSDGIYKKAHVHVVLSFGNAKTNTAVAKIFGINSNYVQIYKGDKILDVRLRYLCHMDDPHKRFYNPGLATGPLSERLLDLQHELARPDNLLLLDGLEYLQGIFETCKVSEWRIVQSVDVTKTLIKSGYGRLVVKSNLKKPIDEWRYDHNFKVKEVKEQLNIEQLVSRIEKLERLLKDKTND